MYSDQNAKVTWKKGSWIVREFPQSPWNIQGIQAPKWPKHPWIHPWGPTGRWPVDTPAAVKALKAPAVETRQVEGSRSLRSSLCYLEKHVRQTPTGFGTNLMLVPKDQWVGTLVGSTFLTKVNLRLQYMSYMYSKYMKYLCKESSSECVYIRLTMYTIYYTDTYTGGGCH